jgi:RNA polymerase sigma-70 factor (ECF subfamily)
MTSRVVHVDVSVQQAGLVSTGPVSFEAFFEEHRDRLARACLLLTGDVADAEDLTQEAMARVLERWDRVSSMESPEGYLYRTAFNLHRNVLKRFAVAARRQLSPPGADEAETTERALDIRRAVRSLPLAQRQALVLVEWLGFRGEEAAEILGIDAASVRGRLHRARATLRNRLGGIDD